jgi:hypothetical protein
MHYLISYNEIITTVTKALFALGAPPGSDSENAKNIAWLATQQFDGVSILADEIKSIESSGGWSKPILTRLSNEVMLTSTIPSSLIIAQTALDFAEIGKIVNIKFCSAPLIIFAEATRRSTNANFFRLYWTMDGLPVEGFCANKFATINSLSKSKQLPGEVMVKLQAGGRFENILSDNNVFHRSLSEGIQVSEQPWKLITQMAKRILVPSSLNSRSSAGAEVDDSN